MKAGLCVLVLLGFVSMVEALPIVNWTYKYDCSVLPGTANCITNNAGTGVAAWTGDTASPRISLGTGADAGTLFINDIGSATHNYIIGPTPAAGALTVYARMAMLQSVATNNVVPFQMSNGAITDKWWVYTDRITNGTAKTIMLDMTVMREFWISVPAGTQGTQPAQMWIKDDSGSWQEIDAGLLTTYVGPRVLFGDSSSTADSKQQWDYIYMNYGQAIAVPEPATMVILGVGGLALLRKRS